MRSFESYVKVFQLKLSNYDKHPWEHSVEQRILQGIDHHSTHDGKARAGLIDVDIVRGSVFNKGKPRHGWMSAIRLGLLRVAFAPFFWNYWRGHTSFRVAVYIMVHFFLQFLQVVFFLLTDPRTSNSSQDDVLLPCLLAVCLGILHAHITAPHGKTSLYSSVKDGPLSAQSFKDTGDQVHNLGANVYHHCPDNLQTDKHGSTQNNLKRPNEYNRHPTHSSNSESRQHLNNIYSANHHLGSSPLHNQDNVDNNSEHPDFVENNCTECYNPSDLVCREYGRSQRNIHWKSGDPEFRKILTSSHKCYSAYPNSDYHGEFSTIYRQSDNNQCELNESDITHETEGPQSALTLEEECGRNKLLHNSQILEHRPRLVRRRRRQNSYSSKHGNSSRGHDADVEESEAESETVPVKKNTDLVGFDDQGVPFDETVNEAHPDPRSQSYLKDNVHHVMNSNHQLTSELKKSSKRVLKKEEDSSEFQQDSSGQLGGNLGANISVNTQSSCEVVPTHDSIIPLKGDQLSKSSSVHPHLSHLSSLSSSTDSFTESTSFSLKRSLSYDCLTKRQQNLSYTDTPNNNNNMLRNSFSEAVLGRSNLSEFFRKQLCDMNEEKGSEYPSKLSLKENQHFQCTYDTKREVGRAYNIPEVSQQKQSTTENTSYRKMSVSSHSSAGTESSTNSARSFNSLRKYPKRSGHIFELESVHDIGAELTANPKCVDSLLDRKMHFSYNDILKSIDVNKKFAVQQDDRFKDLEKLDEFDKKHGVVDFESRDRPEFKNKSYEFINKDDTITVYNRQRAKYLRLFLQRACHSQHQQQLQQARLMMIPPEQTDTDMMESETVLLNNNNNKRSLTNLKHPNKYTSTYTNNDMNFKSSNHRISSLTFTNKSCLKSSSQKVFYNCFEANSSSGNVNNRITTTTDISNSQSSTIHESRRNMNRFMDPISGFVHDTYSHSHYFTKDEQHDTNMNTRGQTASETEYFDRINSDLGSDVDSSSCPDEVEAPSPPTCGNKLPHWQNSNARSDVNLDPIQQRIPKTDQPQVSRRSSYRKHYCPKCRSRPNVSVSSNTDSGPLHSVEEFNNAKNNNDGKSLESEELPPKPVSVPTQGDKIMSNIKEEILHSVTFEQKDQHLDDEVTKENLRNILLKTHLNRDSYAYDNLKSAKYDTVRCYMWAGEKLSKFNLTMLDIGKNVIYAVERQSVSSDYIMLACIATFLLPFVAVIFHSTNNSTNNSDHLIINPSNVQNNDGQFLSSFITGDNILFLENNNSLNQTFFTHLFTSNNSIFGNTVIGLYIRAILSILNHLFSSVLLKMYNLLIGADVQAFNCSQPYCIIFWNIVTGQFFINWFSKPDIQGRLVILIGFILRFNVYGTVFFLLCIAERTFQERLLYAKYFFSLTSGRRALKYRVPQFRLNKIGHIKCWLMLRSYLKKRGPQRSVEIIMATAFYIVFTLGLSLCAQLLSKSRGSVFLQLTNWDILGLTFGIVIFLYRFILLGTKITKKYRNFSVLITEQINLYLSMESKPHKKEDLMLTFQVLRLVESLLKEVDGPFRVCGWTLNPLVYNIFKLVLLSCVSTLLSESLGFKLKLYKLKLNPSNW
uniref:PHTF1/2 N-terminal domain-containing protein n=1 Tax=Trichobilharzia regenti TaxID=157069 RepID=A0AA85K2F0_TRIRE|nr:unnamed protein product [Trichobilharzia regenti]